MVTTKASPINKQALETLLADLPILNEEKRMWYRAGFYITVYSTDTYGSTNSSTIYDHTGTKSNINYNVGLNLRKATIATWENEKELPEGKQAKKTRQEPFDELENRNGT